MGLDMYLYAKRYLSSWDNDESLKSEAICGMFPEIESFRSQDGKEKSPVRYVSIEAGYWRKANAIHKWFVDNIQDGRDDCGTYYVSSDHLIKLKKLCEEVLEDHTKADKLLPSKSGFFYGSTEYNEWYYYDLKNTVAMIEKCLSLSDGLWSFEYSSSW